MCSCFGYALVRGGQKVLMIDGDPATDGLSLFLLGPKGKDYVVRSFFPINTFVGILHDFQKTSNVSFEPHTIHRRAEDDHGVSYDAIISGKGLYGDEAELTAQLAVPDLDQATFRAGVKMLFDALRASGEYSYVLVDTRGGFAFESTDVCALADSFIVVTEPDVTSFYQDRNLVSRINRAAAEMQSPSVLRAMVINKGVDVIDRKDRPYLDNIEVSFRNELTKEFNIPFHTTHGVPVDIDALLAYKTQKIPYIYAPGSLFSFATLSAFSDILEIVTSRWSTEQVDKWNELVNKVTAAVKEKSAKEQRLEEEKAGREREFEELRTKIRERDSALAALDRELTQQKRLYEREFERTTMLLEQSVTVKPPLTFRKEKTVASSEDVAPTSELAAEVQPIPLATASPATRRTKAAVISGLLILLAAALVFLGYLYRSHKTQNTQQNQTRDANAAATSSGSQSNQGSSASQFDLGNYAVLISPSINQADHVHNQCWLQLAGSLSAEEVTRVRLAGYKRVAVYLKSGISHVAVSFDSQDEANAGRSALDQALNNPQDQIFFCNERVTWAASTDSREAMDAWCPLKTAQDPVHLPGESVPVWRCGGVESLMPSLAPLSTRKSPNSKPLK